MIWQGHNLVPRLSVLTNVVHGALCRSANPALWRQGSARIDRDGAWRLVAFLSAFGFIFWAAGTIGFSLGDLGAGGIGIELKVAMDMFEYSRAATIILALFALVLCVEHTSSWLRRRVI